MTIFVFGNPDLAEDSLPLKILPKLRKKFPELVFEVKDPNEEWDVPEKLVVIDTVVGIDRVQVYDNLEPFENSPRVSMHDFDALTQLRYLQKLGKLKEVRVIGVPPAIDERRAFEEIVATLRPTQPA